MKIDLLTSGGAYLKTFETIVECAIFFGKSPSYIRNTVNRKSKIQKNGIFYRIVKFKGEENVKDKR